MGMDEMWVFFDVIIMICALRMLYAFYELKGKDVIPESVLFAKDLKMKDCKDREGLKAFIQNKILIFGIGLLILGAGMLYGDLVGLPQQLVWVIYGGSVVLIAWYGMGVKKARERFF